MVIIQIEGQTVELPKSLAQAFVLAHYPHLDRWIVKSPHRTVELAQASLSRLRKFLSVDDRFQVVTADGQLIGDIVKVYERGESPR